MHPTCNVTLSFTFGSGDVERLGSESASPRKEAASALARELEECIGRAYAVSAVLVDPEEALLIASED